MLVAKRPDHTITRNTNFFKIVNENNYEKQSDDESDVETIDLENQGQSDVGANDDESIAEPVLRRSTRESVPPVRYPVGVTM